MCKEHITFAQKNRNCAMNTTDFNSYIENTIVQNWDHDSLTDYQGATLQYKDVARKIEKLHILFENSGVKKGDKIAICGRNSAHWAVAFLATLTYGATVVPILHEFNAEQIHNIVNHSEARLLFVGDFIAPIINPDEMKALEGIINLPDFSLMMSRTEKLNYARENLNAMFGSKYPKYFRKELISYHHSSEEELALINYTSGTTGFSKGVMLPFRALIGNLDYCERWLGNHVPVESNMLSILPMAHMYGLAMEFIFGFCHGCHLYFLNRLPSPAIIAEAFAKVKPSVVISVPLVIEKIIRKHVFPKTQNNLVRILLQMPVVSKKVKEQICKQVSEAFGGNAYEVIVGGAPLNQEVETFLHSIGFPITVGYGTTECAPLITFSDWHDFVAGSCGRAVDGMEVKIESKDPHHVLGEIITRGKNLMLGYYKNPEATRQAIDDDGWYHTGDQAIMSEDGHVFIKGRIKNMLLGSNGQNIYPEEIEDKLNSMTMVVESLIVQRDNKIVALVYPDFEAVKDMNLTESDLQGIMEHNIAELNSKLPAFSKIASVEIRCEEFAKTPKRSIKRYLYN